MPSRSAFSSRCFWRRTARHVRTGVQKRNRQKITAAVKATDSTEVLAITAVRDSGGEPLLPSCSAAGSVGWVPVEVAEAELVGSAA